MAEIETLEVDGIQVSLDRDKLADTRFITMLGDIEDETFDAAQKMIVQARMLRFVFGGERDRIMDELAERNDGVLKNDAFRAWWIEFLKAANAKN